MSDLRDKTVLVTGATGFLGAYIVRDLMAKGSNVRAFDLHPNRDRLDFVQPGLSKRCTIISGDICDGDALQRAMEGADAIVHLVGLMTIDCANDPLAALRVNLIGGQTLLNAAIAEGVKRIAYASSSSVYGDGDGISPKPASLYGVHKLALEGMARCAWLDHGLASVGFRPAIVYGAGISSGIASGPSRAIRAAVSGQKSEIGFSGRVGFVHVEDVSRAFVQALEALSSGSPVYDLNGVGASVHEFVEELRGQAPDAAVAIADKPLKIPQELCGGDNAPWLNALPVTGLREGISRTLSAWKNSLSIERPDVAQARESVA
ncbi:NAD(P)-dependent oxidoreductase [Notoacmeibacter sp. MSK16QG-6]|uniref:NAD-dependent epimerase/dehydratase family protein n=1 Tax=Notoacmeibacter sp. MSK16QG-6 TaxID=2957982 RepID=UPI0020A076EE|nr:NAD(P)-dependent oxidoreductase [Notoacmeibacter sp. MSK16QG-6]MCP1198329.1 NAD(P)-dependent oxidoreductase [Notoacmeibacter sp. MSK16QG-6]